MQHPSPLKSGLAMFIGSAILLLYWFVDHTASTALVMAIVAALWGIVWVFLQHRSNRDSQREVNTPPYQQPKKGKLVVLSRAWWGFQQGLLLTDHKRLLWLKGHQKVKTGESLSTGRNEAVLILQLRDLSQFTHRAGMWGAGRLELSTENGQHFTFHLKDVEGLALLMDLLSSDEDTPSVTPS
jgi:hypothetical protein